MIDGILDLESLYDFIKRNKEVPHKTYDNDIWRLFKPLIDDLTCAIPEGYGWYFWINANLPERPVYVGKSGAPTNISWDLKKRVTEQLCNYYHVLWATIYDKELVVSTISSKYEDKYEKELRMALKRVNTSHIFWIACGNDISSSDVVEIEKYLIFNLQPIANEKHKKKPNYKKVDGSQDVMNCYHNLLRKCLKND